MKSRGTTPLRQLLTQLAFAGTAILNGLYPGAVTVAVRISLNPHADSAFRLQGHVQPPIQRFLAAQAI